MSDYDLIAQAIRDNMEHFGLSATAMRYHLWNTFDRQFDLDRVFDIDPTPTEQWKAQESFTDDWFPFHETPIQRKGRFAAVVVEAEQHGWLSEDTAAYYLKVKTEDYLRLRDQILELYA